MKRKIIKIITFLICLGVLAMGINTIFGNETITYLSKIRIDLTNGQHFYIWRYDFWTYIKNIQTAIQDVSEFTLNLPTRQWNNDVANNVLLLLDYVIVVINILLYPLRIGAYLLNNILSILGVNNDMNATNNGLKWLYQFVRVVIGIEIPYI